MCNYREPVPHMNLVLQDATLRTFGVATHAHMSEIWSLDNSTTFAWIWVSCICIPPLEMAWALRPLTTMGMTFTNRRHRNVQCMNSILVHVQILNLYFILIRFRKVVFLHTTANRRVSLWHNSFANRTWGILIPMFGSSNNFLPED